MSALKRLSSKKFWEQRWDVNLSLSSRSPQQCPLSSIFLFPAHGSSCWAHTAHTLLFLSAGFKFSFLWHAVAVVKAFCLPTIPKTLIQDVGEIAPFSPAAWGNTSLHTPILEAQASSPVAMLVGTGEQRALPLSFWARHSTRIFLGTLGPRTISQGTGWGRTALRCWLCSQDHILYLFHRQLLGWPRGAFTSKMCNSWLPSGVRWGGFARKAEAFLSMNEVWSVSNWTHKG